MNLTEQALAHAGLTELLARRVQGVALGADELGRLQQADLLVLGAFADEVRRRDCGDEVRVYLRGSPPPRPDFVVLPPPTDGNGTAFFREVARARVGLPAGGRLALDVDAVSLPVALAALPFGVSDFLGTWASQKSLPLVGDTLTAEAKRRELAGCVARAQRVAVFV